MIKNVLLLLLLLFLKGDCVLVDNGYLRWLVTVPPFKETTPLDELQWS
jgi:hypothetical protein